tara:strand:+ start:11009 stop:11884 length:876 start_codon:yes stop_codon:yes gene_type:complete
MHDGIKLASEIVHGGSAIGHNMVEEMLSGYRVLGFDLETTGLDPRKDRIVQYALIGSDVNGSHINQTSFVDPRVPIPTASTKIHGINDNDVKGSGSFDKHANEIKDLMDGAIVIGHNVSKFDWRFIQLEFLRAGIEAPAPRAIVDTLTLAKRLKIPGRHTLGHLCDRYGIEISRAHTADADAGACLLLLWMMMKDHPREFRGDIDDLQDLLSRIPSTEGIGKNLADLEPVNGSEGRLRYWENEIILAFGKHKGRSLTEIYKIDSHYVDWLCSPSSPIPSNIVSDFLRTQRE